MIRRVAVLCFLAFSGFMTLSCSDGSLESPVEPQFTKGGKPGKPPSQEFAITGLIVDKLELGTGETRPISYHEVIVAGVNAYVQENGIDPAIFGCPDDSKTCNKIRMTFDGVLEKFVFNVAHNAGELFYSDDPLLVDRTLAGNWWEQAMPDLLMDGIVGEVEVFWQGQRETGYGSSVSWTLMPDLDVLGQADQFVFTCAYLTASGGKMCGRGKFMDYKIGWAAYHGGDTDDRAYIVLDEIELVTEGGSSKPKKRPSPSSTYVYFDAQAFAETGPLDLPLNYSEPGIVDASVGANFRPMLIEPGENGLKSFIVPGSRGVDPNHPTKSMIEKEQFRAGPFSVAGCHTIEMVGVYVYDVDAVEVVWEPSEDTGDAALSIWIDYIPTDPTQSTWGRGSCTAG